MCGGEKPYLSPDILEEKHCELRQLALDHFKKTKKMGGKDFSLRYQQELEEEIKELYENFCKHNGSKNIFSTFRTPAVLFTGIVALYIASGLTGFIGLEVVAQLFNCIVGLLLIALLTWGYIRYSGQYRELGGAIDSGAAYVLEQVSAASWEGGLTMDTLCFCCKISPFGKLLGERRPENSSLTLFFSDEHYVYYPFLGY